jgi:RNA polymerase sigma-70 factor (ECF subfamily)
MADVATQHDRAPRTGPPGRAAVEGALEQHRHELTGYCYRMLGSAFDAEDAVQETLVRAWRNADRFEGRSSLRSWLFRIATNVCLDVLTGKQRRVRPMEVGPLVQGPAAPGEPRVEDMWVMPVPDRRVVPADGDPAEIVAARESIRLAFVTALQHLPARQRAVLILREVLHWKADEVAALLDATVASVNSALQRARSTLATVDITESDPVEPTDPAQQALLARYVDAFERYDLDSLTSLLHEDVTQSMPPYDMWLRGTEAIRQWWLGPGIGCRGSRLVPTMANGSPAFGQYRASGPGGAHQPWSLQVLEIADGRITGMTFFLDTEAVFPLFGLPPTPATEA